MRTAIREVGDVVIVDLDGDLVAGVGDVVLREAVNQLLAQDRRRILINLAQVERLDSSGLGELVASWKLAHRFGASMKLLRPGDRVRYTLHLSQVLPLMEVFEEEAPAVRSFSAHGDRRDRPPA
jgi:anti-sigma B factor antagonist